MVLQLSEGLFFPRHPGNALIVVTVAGSARLGWRQLAWFSLLCLTLALLSMLAIPLAAPFVELFLERPFLFVSVFLFLSI
jgi:hypothetical protein